MRVPAVVPIVSPAQFVHEILEARGQARRFGAEALLQRFTDALADRPAGRAIDRMAAIAAVPIQMSSVCFLVDPCCVKSFGRRLFPATWDCMQLSLKLHEPQASPLGRSTKSPGARHRGLVGRWTIELSSSD
jgi:hypothetical protein